MRRGGAGQGAIIIGSETDEHDRRVPECPVCVDGGVWVLVLVYVSTPKNPEHDEPQCLNRARCVEAPASRVAGVTAG